MDCCLMLRQVGTSFGGCWGVGWVWESVPFSYFLVSTLGPHDFPYDIPIPPVWLCCAVYFILSSCVARLHRAACDISEDLPNVQVRQATLLG